MAETSEEIIFSVRGEEFLTERSAFISKHVQGSFFEQLLARPEKNEKELREFRQEAVFYRLNGLKDLIDETYAMRTLFKSLISSLRKMGKVPLEPVSVPASILPGSIHYVASVSREDAADHSSDMALGLLNTASPDELETAKKIANKGIITLYFLSAAGGDLGSIGVSLDQMVRTLLSMEHMRENILKKLDEMAPKSDEMAPQSAPPPNTYAAPPPPTTYVAYPSYTPPVPEGAYSIVTAGGVDILKEAVPGLQPITFEMLGLKDGETLTIVKLAVETRPTYAAALPIYAPTPLTY